jgi:anti-sigma B factor antagonist
MLWPGYCDRAIEPLQTLVARFEATGGGAMRMTMSAQGRDADCPLACGDLTGGTGDLLTWAIDSRGPPVIIVLLGELDIATAPGLAMQLDSLAETGRDLILDLAGLRFCDCAGLSALLRVRQRATAAGGSLHLTALTPALRRFITLVRLHDLLPIAACPANMISVPGGSAVPALPHPDDADRVAIARQEASSLPTVSVAS